MRSSSGHDPSGTPTRVWAAGRKPRHQGRNQKIRQSAERRPSGRRAVAVLVGLAGLMVGGASLAWACSPQAWIHLEPHQARAGSDVMVTGQKFYEGPVEIRWSSATGPVLSPAQGSDFSTTVTIPSDASPGVYYIVAVQTPYEHSASFEVVPASSSTTDGEAGDPSGDSTGTTSQRTSATSSDDSGADNDSETSSLSGGEGGTSDSSGTQESTPADSSSEFSTAGTDSTGQATRDDGEQQSTANGSADELRTGKPQSTDEGQTADATPRAAAGAREPHSLSGAGAPGTADDASARERRENADAEAAVLSTGGEPVAINERDTDARQAVETDAQYAHTGREAQRRSVATGTASEDLWSGFVETEDRTSLVPSLGGVSQTVTRDSAGQAALALTLFGGGLISLFGGFFVAATTRLRARRARRD